MYFKQFIAPDLGCASYLIGDSGSAECAIIDPRWNIQEYLDIAADKGMLITYVIETHNHADHVSGHGKLAALGAKVAIFKSAEVDYTHISLKDGDTITMGDVRLQVIHTPGHRPEHIAIAVSDLSRSEEPWMVLTGDSLFVGDVGRPDLAIQPEEGASQLYASLKQRLLPLGDGVEVYPAHVAGSLCGKSMSEKGNSTIGFERRWNAPLRKRTEATFIKSVTSELPPQPPQFARIVAMNRGPFITADIDALPISPTEVDRLRQQIDILILDTRSPQAFGGGHIPGALNVYLDGGQFATRASWVIPPKAGIILVLESPDNLDQALERMAMAGQRNIRGYLLGGMTSWEESDLPIETIPQLSVEEVRLRIEAKDRGFVVLDVRENSEWNEQHIPGAIHIPFHALKSRLDELPTRKTIAAFCGGGIRSSIAASILQAQGFTTNNIPGGMSAWEATGGPLE